MHKSFKWIIGIVLLAGFGFLMHHFALFNETGLLVEKGKATSCVSTGEPVPHYYRLIPNGFGGFNEDQKHFEYTDSGATCGQPVELRLYLW